MKRGTDKFRHFGKCTHGRNWGHLGGDQICDADATHERRGFPERLACQFHAFEAERSTPGDPNWIPFEGTADA